MDVTVISSLQHQTLPQAASNRGSPLAVAEHRKNTVQLPACHSRGVQFQPLAVEALGGLSLAASSVIKSIGSHLASRRGLDPLEVSHHLFQRLSVALWH